MLDSVSGDVFLICFGSNRRRRRIQQGPHGYVVRRLQNSRQIDGADPGVLLVEEIDLICVFKGFLAQSLKDLPDSFIQICPRHVPH